jgi:endonuclease/exonuclease/phosphatase family metal-dependent hydrolase
VAGSSLRVVSFNILHGRSGGSDGPGRVDLDLLAMTCAGFSADVLALQEVDWGIPRSRMANLARLVGEAAGMEWQFGVSVKRGPLGEYGNALLVRGSIEDVRVVPLVRHGRSEPRTAMVGRVIPAALGRHMSVAATHLSIDVGGAREQLGQLVAALRELPPPRVLLGDLNLEVADVEPVVMAAGLRLLASPPTFPAHAPRLKIDHVAVSPELQAERVDVVQTPSSDHRSLVVDLWTED